MFIQYSNFKEKFGSSFLRKSSNGENIQKISVNIIPAYTFPN